MKGIALLQGEIIKQKSKNTLKRKKISKPISIKLGTNYPWVKGILIVQIKGQVIFKGEIITKMGWGNLLLKNRCLRIGHIFT
jgi:hypothetical protein